MKKILLYILPFALLATSCDDDETTTGLDNSLKTEFVENYVAIVRASYADALTEAKELQTAVDALVEDPNHANFTAAKQAWLDAREPYGQTEVYRFYDGPIDGDGGEPGTGGEELSASQNIIGNVTDYPTIDEATLRGVTGANDNESNVSLGYHAIEFLLWGQDSDDPSALTTGARTHADYTEADNYERRGQYLKVVTDILISDLESVVDQWENDGSFRDEFLALDVNDAIDNILTGAAKLSKGELAGERMAVAVENQSQEDEHSCFSDNTNRDIFLNAEGIDNIINGSYTSVDGTIVSGTSLLDLLAIADATQATSLTTQAAEVQTKVQAISDAGHFDFLIIGESLDDTSKPVMSAVSSLREQGDLIAAAALAITGGTISGDLE